MQISHKDPHFEDYVIFLDNRLIRTPLAANDEEGWVDILDIAAMSPPLFPEKDATPPKNSKASLKAKRRFGNVTIQRIS